MEVEWHAVFNALHLGDNDPAIVAEPGTFPGLSAAGDTFDLVVVLLQIIFNMDFLQHRFVNDFFVADLLENYYACKMNAEMIKG